MSTDLLDILWCDGKQVDLVGQALARLHRRDVWVDNDCVDPLLFQCLDSLAQGIVEL